MSGYWGTAPFSGSSGAADVLTGVGLRPGRVQSAFVPPVSAIRQVRGKGGADRVRGSLWWLARIDEYRVVCRLAEGGMGVVVLAREPDCERFVAIKLMRRDLAQRESLVRRFLAETEYLQALAHRSIVSVLKVCDLPERPYFVMPFLAAGSLSERTRGGRPLSAWLAGQLAGQIARALEHVHRQGVLHCDVSPGNVLIDDRLNGFLTDFGLARKVGAATGAASVRRSRPEGTAPYVSPEIVAGAGPDERTEVYAFGATLYEMLTGHAPYRGANDEEVFGLIRAGAPCPVLRVNPMAHPRLVAIAERAMARSPAARYGCMSEVVGDLERVLNHE